VVSAKSTSVPASSSPAVTTVAPGVETKPAASPVSNLNSAPAPVAPVPSSPQPSRNLEPISSPVAPAPASEVKSSNTTARNTPAPQPPKKPALGEVHLAAPVVSRGAEEQPDSATLPSVDINASSNSAPDALADVATARYPQPSAPLPVGGDVKPAQLIKSVPPTYPPVAKAQHITGAVTIDCLIDASGDVAQLKVVSGPPLLHRAAADAVKQWKYKPAILDGQPTSMHLTVTVQFRAQ
jgi:periplasmic protein TonB